MTCATSFLIEKEFAFRGANQHQSSLNRGNYVKLMKFPPKYDEKLAQY